MLNLAVVSGIALTVSSLAKQFAPIFPQHFDPSVLHQLDQLASMGQPVSKQGVQDVVKAKKTPSGEFVLLSAHSMESLIASIKSLEDIASTLDHDGLSQLGTQSRLRCSSKFRRGIYATTPEMLHSKLQMDPEPRPSWPGAPGTPLLVLLAPGNGCQSAGMLKPTLEGIPAARQIFEEVMSALSSKSIDWSLLLGCGDPSTLSTFDQQALLFAHSMVMSNLMAKLGLKADAVLGHSAGELTCACASGALDIAQSCRLFLAKVGSMDAMTSDADVQGSMAVANFGAADISHILESFNAHLPEEEKVLVAADNSSSCCTLTGLKTSLSKFKASLPEEFKASWKDMGLPRAYHHRELCKGAAEHFEQQYCEEVPRKFSSRFFSTVTGKELSAAELTKDYWKRHTLEPVRFREATLEVLKAMGSDGDRPIVFVELKAQNRRHILQAAQDLGMNNVHYQSLTKKQDETDEIENLCDSVAKLWEKGLSVECELFPARKFKPRHDLKHEPRTHFCRQPAFQPLQPLQPPRTAPGIASPASSQRSLANSKASTDSIDSSATVWSKELSHPILKQHLFSGKELVPAALILVALVDAGYSDLQLKFMTSCYAHGGSAQVVLQVLDGHITVKSPDQQNHYSEGMVNPACTAPAADWVEKWKELSSDFQTQRSKHLLSPSLLKKTLSGLRFRPSASMEEVDCEVLQSLLQSGGLFFGRNLRLSGKVLVQKNQELKSSFGLARVQYAEELQDYSPVLIDQAIQLSLGLCLHQLSEVERAKGAVPIQVEKFTVFRPKILAQYDWLHCVVEVKPKVIDSAICASFALIASDGTLVATAHNLWGKLQSSKAVPLQELMWQIRPTETLPPAEPVKQKKFLAFCDDSIDSIMAQLMKNQLAPADVIIIGVEEQLKPVSLSIPQTLQRTGTSLEKIDAIIYEWTSGVDVDRLGELEVVAADEKIRRQCARFRELIIFVSTSQKDILVITKGSPQFAEQKSEVSHPGSGMFMAMTKSLVNEGQPGKGLLHCIELSDTTAASIETLANEITNPRADTSEIRICAGQVQRLELLPVMVSYDSLLSGNCLKKVSTASASTYLILGGLKGESLSALLLQFLAQRRHGDNIVVVGRSAADEAFKILQKKVVKEFGVRVIPIQADITEPRSLERALKKSGIKSKDVKGVLHGAACFDGDHMIHKVTNEQFEKTLAPKVRGSLEIFATAQREEWSLDFFVYLSSVVVSLGNYGQVAYGGRPHICRTIFNLFICRFMGDGANGFQADLGTWQAWKQNKTKVQVINFTVLDQVGVMHGQDLLQKNLDETRGFPAINKATIYQALDATMRLGLPMVTVATFDRQKLTTLALANDPCVASRFHTVMARFTGASPASPATSGLVPSSAASSAESVASVASVASPASEPTASAAPLAAPAVVASVTRREAFLGKIKDVMGVTELDMTKSLEKQGLDSMTAIECRQQLKDSLSVDIELLELSERPLSDVLKKVGF